MDGSDSLMVLSSGFDDPGDWTIRHSYLLARGLGEPLPKDARIKVFVPKTGDYSLWVWTRNWKVLFGDEESPALFQVLLDGKPDDTLFGTGCGGETRWEQSQWCWQQGGLWFLEEGAHEIALHDLSGFGGRCGAILLTLGRETPGSSLESYLELRSAILGENPGEDDRLLF